MAAVLLAGLRGSGLLRRRLLAVLGATPGSPTAARRAPGGLDRPRRRRRGEPAQQRGRRPRSCSGGCSPPYRLTTRVRRTKRKAESILWPVAILKRVTNCSSTTAWKRRAAARKS